MLSIAEAAKAIGVTRLQLYNVINGRREMAVCFEKASGGSADLWLRTHAARDLTKVHQSREKITVRRLARPVSWGSL
jgi:antitoxin HigA-1